MSLKYAIEVYELLDDYQINGEKVKTYLEAISPEEKITVETVQGEKGSTDFISIHIEGTDGKLRNGDAPTLGIVGRLGGIGARPETKGFVSDGDGALTAVATAAKLLDMTKKGDRLKGDILISTHICPDAPTQPHDPVPFMGSPVDILTMNKYEVFPEMDAILSIDTTKGNVVTNHRGFAITPTIKEGYILRMSNDLLDVYQQVAGILPVTLPISIQDITPYGNGLYHINSIMQPGVAATAPVVGVAITTQTAVAGSGSNATHLPDIDQVIRFAIETAQRFGNETCAFYDAEEFEKIIELYGPMTRFQTLGKKEGEAGNDK